MGFFEESGTASSKMINSSNETVNLLGCMTNAIKIVESDSENLLEGNKFWAGTSIDVGATTADNTMYILGIVSAPLTLMSSRSIQTVSTAAISVQINLYEDVATSTASGNVTSYCMNRNVTSVGTFTINDDPAAITATGTLMPPTNLIKSTANFGFNTEAEYIYEMKNNVKYALKVQNDGVATATITFLWTWTEI